MITYKIQKGDTLTSIAYKYQTTIAILLEDNPYITNPNLIYEGKSLKIRSSAEYAKDAANKAAQATATASSKAAALPTKSVLTNNVTKEEQKAGGLTVTNKQVGVVKWNVNGGIYSISSDGKLTKSRSVKKGDRYRYYGEVKDFGGLYILGGVNVYAKKSEVSIEVNPPQTTTGATQPSPKAQAVKLKMAHFELPGYKRTRLKVKTKDGTYRTIEMRITSFAPNYSANYTPTRTNAGWLISVGGQNLTPISISGHLLDTQTNKEVKDFLDFYKTNLTPKNDVDYFSAEIVTILHKSREYKGVIQNLTFSDTVTTPLHQGFQMQFLCFLDKSITDSEIKKNYPDVISRGNMTELEFRSDLVKMLTNPITGKFAIDND